MILQIIAFQALFLLVYDLFLKRETFFNYNRAYLMLTSVLSLILPFVKFPTLKKLATKDMVIHLPEVFIGAKTPTAYDIQIAEQVGIILEQPKTPIWQIVALSGIGIATLIFLIKITKLYWVKYKNPKRWKGNVLIVNLIKSSVAYSFFNTIFLGEHISESEKSTIYEHEMVHIKELHSLDLLFFELLRIIFWFNPLVYIYQNRIKELHEYIADAKAVKQSGKSEYYKSLLNQVLDVNQASFTNAFFNTSLIKKRIVMLQKTKSKQLNLIKYTLLIPMVFGMLIYTSTEVRAQEKTDIKQELTEAELVKKYYDEFGAMKKNGSSFFEISDYAGFSKGKTIKYLMSKKEFLKMKAFLIYLSEDDIRNKYEGGTLTQVDIDGSKFMSMDKFKTYEEFKAFKNTKEEKERWELGTQDGILKLYVEDLSNKTDEEEKKLDGLLKQLESDTYFHKLIITDGIQSMVLDSYISKEGEDVIKDEIVEVPFSVVDETPTTIDCKDLESNEDRKNCFNNFVNKHIAKNFNTSIGDSLSPGRKRVFVQFKVDKDGTIKHIVARGPSPELEAEAKRVLATLPQFIPGKQKGEVVVVPFSIPIVFQVKYDSNANPNSVIERYIMTDQDIIQENTTELKKLPFSTVEIAPVHPKCSTLVSNLEKRQCTTNTINAFVNKKFNTALARSLGLGSGKIQIFASFDIDKKGDIINIRAKGEHPELEKEAIRVMKLLPKFTPGIERGEVIEVLYSLPIVFQIHDIKKD
ncbi:energy transducer TonB [Winogradskyella wichelsiae]|uniref:energy transducer TonB n=1 Tax=Winogradskyella wichelsiae TaxID=2697007 RepID=UPI003EF73C6D